MSRPRAIKEENYPYYQIIGQNIRHFRTVRNISQEELASSAGMSRNHLNSIESQYQIKSCSLEMLFDIAKALDIEPFRLFKPLS